MKSAADEPGAVEPAAEGGASRPLASARGTGRRHRIKVLRRRVGRAVALTFAPSLVRGLARTWRETIEGESRLDLLRQRGGYFMALWHGRMLIPAAHHARQGYAILVSPSGDGDVSEAMLRRLGYGVVRGSTSRRGRAAIRELIGLLRAGTPVAITPDGPRGPSESMSMGLAWLSAATGFPVVPCGFVAAQAWRLSSWDRFTIPKPFSRVAFVYEEPVHVDRADDSGLDRATEEIRTRIQRAERRGFELLGVEPDG
ncbi:MAG: lysophospholipid acyltransferase family protein [Planctomycetes bacterium]|nr:lysophospholipid acyltransferase family protein [Planctomycetota bacterium]